MRLSIRSQERILNLMVETDETTRERETVNRIVFPTTDAESTLPLYVVNWTPSHPDPALFDARESLEKVAFSSLS